MRCRNLLTTIILVIAGASTAARPLSVSPCHGDSLSVATSVADLLHRMTTEEKVGQLLCPMGWDYDYAHDTLFVGNLWATFRADPWTGRDFSNGLTPPFAARKANAMQRHVRENTRLGIPLLLAEEAPHGHMALGTTVFPTGLALAATFDTTLIRRIGQAIAAEVRAQGAHVTYGPVLDLARDPRWSRTEETFGEDPVLTATLGAAMVRGLRDHCDNSITATATVPVLKHFGAYGLGLGGQNGAAATIGRREMLEACLYPFRRAIEAGALGVMTAYNAADGRPATADRWLLHDILRDRWGFNGLVISDLYAINVLHNTLHTAPTLAAAARQALDAGVDIDLGALAYQELADNSETTAALDSAVARVLRLKYELGLFDNPYVDEDAAATTVHHPSHIALARDVALAAVTLLKNDGTLPIQKGTRVYVCGPNADDRYALLGDYTAPQRPENVHTVREAVAHFATIVPTPSEADVLIAVVGGSSSRYAGTSYAETGAAITNGEISPIGSGAGGEATAPDSGEGLDRCTLDLPAAQQHLLDTLHQTGKPLIVIYVEGRPLLKNWAAEHSNALLTAFYPGEQGAAAIADVLFGYHNPSGRLPISVPRSVGQLPVYYNRPLPATHDYVDGPATPLYPFGYGLSYTTFDYSGLQVSKVDEANEANGAYEINGAEGWDITFTVTNTGSRDGDEVPQLYITSPASPVVQPPLQLRHFARVHVPAGEARRVTFHLAPSDLAVIDADLNEVIVPGTYTLRIGASSADIRLTGTLTITDSSTSGSPRGDIVEAAVPDASPSGYVAPSDPLVQQRLATWQDLKFGIILHWGLYSVPGIVESWSICDENWITRDTTRTYDEYKRWYWGLANEFRPTHFDPAQWADIAAAAGMRYMLFTTKHHDGFCLWNSRLTDFTVTHYSPADAPWHDALGPVLDAFRHRDFMLGTYFSKPDWHSQDYWWDVYTTRGRNVNYPVATFPDRWRRFQQYTYGQIEEILSGYGNVDILWLDGGWVCAENNQDIDMSRIATMARRHQPGLIIVDRTIRGPYENYQTPEQTIPATQQLTPWESCITLSDDWGWVPRPRWKSPEQVIATLVEVVAKGGNLVLGVGPTAEGLIQPEAEQRLRAIGQWLDKNGRAIYGTRPTPHYHEGDIWFTAAKTQPKGNADNRLFAIYVPSATEPARTTLTWHNNLPRRGTAMRLLSTGQRLRYTLTADSVTVSLPQHMGSQAVAIEFTPAE